MLQPTVNNRPSTALVTKINNLPTHERALDSEMGKVGINKTTAQRLHYPSTAGKKKCQKVQIDISAQSHHLHLKQRSWKKKKKGLRFKIKMYLSIFFAVRNDPVKVARQVYSSSPVPVLN